MRRGHEPTASGTGQRLKILRRQLEARKLEAGRHRAADQAPGAAAFRALPCPRRHHGLRSLPGREIRAQLKAAELASIGDPEQERGAGVPMPYLGRIDAVPARWLT